MKKENQLSIAEMKSILGGVAAANLCDGDWGSNPNYDICNNCCISFYKDSPNPQDIVLFCDAGCNANQPPLPPLPPIYFV